VSKVLELPEDIEFKTSAGVFVVGKDGMPVMREPKRGPLGGELKRLDQCKVGQRVIVEATVGENCCLDFAGIIGRNLIVETNVPPRQSLMGEKMAAGEAAATDGIVGRWVAVQVTENDFASQLPLYFQRYCIGSVVPVILLPEGFGQ
jgi:hypothetical protein